MAIIDKNEIGSLVVNNKVLEKIIIEDILRLSNKVLLCDKKGKLIKRKPTPFIDSDYYDAVEVNETTRDGFCIKILLIVVEGFNPNDVANEIFDLIEKELELLQVAVPDLMTIYCKGIMTSQINKRNIEISRKKRT